ncbi:MAG TPA: hypothetical protein VK843_14860 [Planctomycetota bacterium]|nr:hypothetical protein [Planctomycetota bacterium]
MTGRGTPPSERTGDDPRPHFFSRTGLIAFLPSALLLAILYFPALKMGFVSDDHLFLSRKLGLATLLPASSAYIFSPLMEGTFLVLKKLFHADPRLFHLFAILLHALTCYGVVALVHGLKNSSIAAATAGLLFAGFAFAYEPVLWVTGAVAYLPMALAAVIAVWRVVRRNAALEFVARPDLLGGALLLVSSLYHEIGLAILPISVLLTRGLRPSIPWKDLVVIHIPHVLFAALLLLTNVTLTGTLGPAPKFSWSEALLTFSRAHGYCYFPFANLLQEPGMPLVVAAVLGAVSVGLSIFLWSSTRWRLQGALLSLFHCSVLVFAVSAQHVQARYLYLPEVFAASMLGLLAADAFATLKRGFGPLGTRRVVHLTISCLILTALSVSIAQGIRQLRERVEEWGRATEISRHVLESAVLEFMRAEPALRKSMIVVDLPDGLQGSQWPAFLFRNGFREAFAQEVRDHNSQGQEIELPAIVECRTGPWTSAPGSRLGALRTVSRHPRVGPEFLRGKAAQALVLRFDAEQHCLVRYVP